MPGGTALTYSVSSTYALTPSDFLKFDRSVLALHPAAYISNFFGTGINVGILCFLAVWKYETTGYKASLITGCVVGALVSLLTHIQHRSATKTAITRLQTEKTAVFSERHAHFSANGFREQTPDSDCYHTWNDFETVVVSPGHAFLFTTRFTAFIIPLDRVPSEVIPILRAHVPHKKLRTLRA